MLTSKLEPMKKLFLVAVLSIAVLGLTSCEPESAAETDELYGIDRDKVETPGNKGS